MLRLFASQAAIALDNSRLYGQAREWSAQAHCQLELVKKLLDGIQDPLSLLDADDRVVFGNQALFTALGRRPNELLGHKWYEFVDREDADALRVQHETEGEDGVITREVQLLRPDGTRAPVLVRSGHTLDAAGRVLGTMAVMVDFAARQRVERTLRRRTSMLAAIGRLTRAVGTVADIQRLAQQALDSSLRLTGLKCGVIYLVEEADWVLAAARNIKPEHVERTTRFPIQGSFSALPEIMNRGSIPKILAEIWQHCVKHAWIHRRRGGKIQISFQTTRFHIFAPLYGFSNKTCNLRIISEFSVPIQGVLNPSTSDPNDNLSLDIIPSIIARRLTTLINNFWSVVCMGQDRNSSRNSQQVIECFQIPTATWILTGSTMIGQR